MINKLKNNKKGFTLIELIVIIAIIGILVLLATPKFLNYTAEAREANITNDIKVMENKVLEYLIRNDDNLPNDWASLDNNTILEEAKEENKLYNVKGIVPIDNVINGTFKVVSDDFTNTNLKGKFYVNENIEVYYVNSKDNKESKPVEDDPSDFTYHINVDGVQIASYIGSRKDIVIPEKIENLPVTYISDYVFYNKGLTSIIIPGTVKEIGNSAFSENNLTEITIPNSVEIIQPWAFQGNQLTKVVIPDSVKEIGEYAFYNNQISYLKLSNLVESIGNLAFSNNNLTELLIPKSLNTIESNTFANNQLTKINIPDNITELKYGAFSDNNISEITIGNNVTIDVFLLYDDDNSFRNEYELNSRESGTYKLINGTWTKQ